MRDLARGATVALVIVTAAIVAAAIHQLLALLGTHEISAHYRHVAVVPIMCGALVGLAIAALSIVRYTVCAADRAAAIARTADYVTSLSALSLCAGIALTAIVIFATGEAVEQYIAFGHVLPGLLGVSPLLVVLVAAFSALSSTILKSLFLLLLATVAAIVEWLFCRCAAAARPSPLYSAPRFVLPFARLAARSATRRGPPIGLHVA